MRLYFADCETLEDVKDTFRKYAKELHPDNNPDKDTAQEFAEMRSQYEAAFARCKDIHKNSKGETYTKTTDETPEEFANIINAVLKMEGVHIELIGAWLWVTGNTAAYKDSLKALGFRWASVKKAWNYHREPWHGRASRGDLDSIRAKYGSVGFRAAEEKEMIA